MESQWFIALRDVTNATNERTANYALNPLLRQSTANYLSCSLQRIPPVAALLANLNYLVLDYVRVRRLVERHLTYLYSDQLPVLPPSCYIRNAINFITTRVLELTYTSHSMAPSPATSDYDGRPFPWDEDRRALLRAELDAWYARAYGLSRDELRYILDPADVMGPDYPSETFRVLKNNEERKLRGVPHPAPRPRCLGPHGARRTPQARTLPTTRRWH